VTTSQVAGTREEWLLARRRLLDREKELTGLSDELARERQQLPWVPIDKEYRFTTDAGERTLAELFDGRSQLLVYHFMFGPNWPEGCPRCSLLADHFDGALPHLNARDVTLGCVSRGPLERLLGYRRRMGWRFPWVSSLGSDFKFDFGVSFTQEQRAAGATYNFRHMESPPEEMPDISTSALCDGTVHHVYSAPTHAEEMCSPAPTSCLTARRWGAPRTRCRGRWHGCDVTTNTNGKRSHDKGRSEARRHEGEASLRRRDIDRCRPVG